MSRNKHESSEASPLLLRVRSLMPSLQPSDARVAAAIVEDPEATIYRSVSEMAEVAQTSTATVVRCAKKLGYTGFQPLKLALAREQSAFADTAHRESDDAERAGALARVTEQSAQAVRDAGKMVDPAAFEAAATALAAADRVLVTGVGTSAPVAQDAAYRFRVIGVPAEAPADVHVQHVAARLLNNTGVCVGVSHNGSTRETLTSLEYARASGATTIALTSFLRSPLAELADVVLVAGTREVSFRLEAMASRLAHLAVTDALVLATAERTPERAQMTLDQYADVVSEHRY